MLDFQLLEIFSLSFFHIGISISSGGIADIFGNNSSRLTISLVSATAIPCVLSKSFPLISMSSSSDIVLKTVSSVFSFLLSWTLCNSRQFLREYCSNSSISLVRLFFFFLLNYQSLPPFLLFFRFFSFSRSRSPNLFEKNSSDSVTLLRAFFRFFV